MKQLKELNRNQQLVVNMSASFLAYGISLFISFFLSPYLVRTIGVEANGFVGLANNFISYATLLTVALNSLAGRFITIEVVQGNTKKANMYFSSVFIANLVIGIVLALIGAGIVLNLTSIINIPENITGDVRMLFFCLFANCIVSIVGSVFSVATFARNKLYLQSIRNIESNIIRTLVIIGAFAFFAPKVTYIGLGSLIAGIYLFFANIYYTRLLLPEISIGIRDFDLTAILEILSSGIWNTINRLGQLLLDGLDLLITNLFIDATAMGVLSLSKTVPSLISGLLSSLVGVFSPDFTILYAEGKREELIKSVIRSMKIMGTMINTPIIVLIVCGEDFFRLWQPTQDAKVLQKLFLLTIGCLIFSGGINCIYNIFTVVNKIRTNAIVVLVCGAISTGTTLFLVRNTDLGIFAVAGVSTAISILRNLAFTAPYGARCLELKWYSLYPAIFKPVLFTVIGVVVGFLIGGQIVATNWVFWFAKACLIGIISLVIGIFVILNREERNMVISKVVKRIRRRKE